MKEKILEHGIDQTFFITAAVALLTVTTFLLANGVQISEARGTCYTEIKTCKGLPFNGSCIGEVQIEEKFDSAQQCSQLESIEASCNSVKENLCASSEYSGDEWKRAVVEGFSCSTWEKQYSSVDLKSCGSNN